MAKDVVALQNQIRQWLKERNAILLAHYYQRDEVQEIADILGDSLALSMQAARSDAAVLVFAGVHFMAESASIISPDKTVLLPRMDAGCPLADMITAEQLERARQDHPGVPVVTYINSSAAVKALSDVCCTSANAVKVVHSLTEARQVLMTPDGNLARYVARFTDKQVIPWEGYCPIHHFLDRHDVMAIRKRHPQAPFAAHPECRSEVLVLADFVGSTSAILRFAKESTAAEIIVGTEKGILCQLRKENPDKTFILASETLLCETMKRITLEDILASLQNMQHVIKVPDHVRIPAKKALDRMLQIS